MLNQLLFHVKHHYLGTFNVIALSFLLTSSYRHLTVSMLMLSLQAK